MWMRASLSPTLVIIYKACSHREISLSVCVRPGKETRRDSWEAKQTKMVNYWMIFQSIKIHLISFKSRYYINSSELWYSPGWLGGDGRRLRKRVGRRLGDCTTHPHPVSFFVNQKVLPAPRRMCSRNPLRHRIQSFGSLLLFGHQAMYLKDTQISAQQKCTLAQFGLHSNCLHHSALCCVHEPDLRASPSPRTIFKTLRTVHQNLGGNKSDSFCLPVLLSSCYT